MLRKSVIEGTAEWFAELKQKWSILTHSGLNLRCAELNGDGSLIEGLLPQGSLSVMVGDSGLGKSPLLYQAALCVATGMPFLGHFATQGRVLYLDFENGLSDVKGLLSRLSGYLQLDDIPEDLLLWNFNDLNGEWSPDDLANMIRHVRPSWVVIDSLTAFAPDIEERPSNATRVYQEFRKIAREHHTSITGVHHIRKPSSKREEAPPPLEEDPHRWFVQARGSRVLINGCDVRIGIDLHRKRRANLLPDTSEVSLVIGGFGRVRGMLPTMFVARVLDEDGEALGYEEMSGTKLLFNSEQEEAYHKLPIAFRFKDAERIYNRGSQATSDFLKKCISVGIMRKEGRQYRKSKTAE
jgi:hypothetical protein